MKKLVLFGSPHCPQCGPVKEFLEENNVEFSYIDMTGSMLNLKTFLKYRDTSPVFEDVKARGAVGVPCIVINDGEKIILGKPDLAELA